MQLGNARQNGQSFGRLVFQCPSFGEPQLEVNGVLNQRRLFGLQEQCLGLGMLSAPAVDPGANDVGSRSLRRSEVRFSRCDKLLGFVETALVVANPCALEKDTVIVRFDGSCALVLFPGFI